MLTILEKVDLLRKTAMFGGIPTPALARVAAIANEATFAPSQMLYQEHSSAESMFLLLEGEVELTRSERKTHIDEPGRALGALALLAGGTYSESAKATQVTSALQIERQDLLDAMAEDFDVARGLVKVLAAMAAGVS